MTDKSTEEVLAAAAAASAKADTAKAAGPKSTPKADAPPKNIVEDPEDDSGPDRGPTLSPPKLTPKWKSLHTKVAELYTGAGMAAWALGDGFTANALINNADGLATSWINLAQQNKRVEELLNRLTQGSAWSGVIVGHAGLLLPVLAHHNLLPSSISGMFGNANGNGDLS